jgi:hypothetical protein
MNHSICPYCPRPKANRFLSATKILLFLALQSLSVMGVCSAPPPCVLASQSPDGHTLVVNDLLAKLLNPNEKGTSTSANLFVLRHSFDEHSEKDRVPGRMWIGLPMWSVALANSVDHPSVSCPKVVVTNDGQTLAIIDARPIASILWVYRSAIGKHPPQDEMQRGELVRQIPDSELWPNTKPSSPLSMPREVFVGASFELSPDQQKLLCTNRNGETSEIDLTDGHVTPKPKPQAH